jgi:hypothetical protein
MFFSLFEKGYILYMCIYSLILMVSLQVFPAFQILIVHWDAFVYKNSASYPALFYLYVTNNWLCKRVGLINVCSLFKRVISGQRVSYK